MNREIVNGLLTIAVATGSYLPLAERNRSSDSTPTSPPVTQEPIQSETPDRTKELPMLAFNVNFHEIIGVQTKPDQVVVMNGDQTKIITQEPSDDGLSTVINERIWDGQTFSDPNTIASGIYGRMTASPGVIDNGFFFLTHHDGESYVFRGILNNQTTPDSYPLNPVSTTGSIKAAKKDGKFGVAMAYSRDYLLSSGKTENNTFIAVGLYNEQSNQWDSTYEFETNQGSPEDVNLSLLATDQELSLLYLRPTPDGSNVLLKRTIGPQLSDVDVNSNYISGVKEFTNHDEYIAVTTSEDTVELYKWAGNNLEELSIITPIVAVDGVYDLSKKGIMGTLIVGRTASNEIAISSGSGQLWNTEIVSNDQIRRIVSTNVTNEGDKITFLAEGNNMETYLVTIDPVTDPNNPTS